MLVRLHTRTTGPVMPRNRSERLPSRPAVWAYGKACRRWLAGEPLEGPGFSTLWFRLGADDVRAILNTCGMRPQASSDRAWRTTVASFIEKNYAP
jgi:hypothetical protein